MSGCLHPLRFAFALRGGAGARAATRRGAATTWRTKQQHLGVVAWTHEAPPQQQQRRRLSTSSNAVLSNTTSFLRNLHTGAEIFLVGTAHVSRRSSEEVRDMIRLVKPGAVMVELCAARAARLRAGDAPGDADFLRQLFETAAAPGASFSQKLVKAGLPVMYRALKALGMDPGGEFKVALHEADRIGARVVMGDRDVQATLQRLAESVSLPDLLRMMGGSAPDPPAALAEFFMQQGSSSVESQVEALKTRAMVREMCRYMRQVNPQLAQALIDERDEHMVSVLSKLEGRVVGVVGLAHLDGIERRWEARMYSRQALAGR